MSNVAYIDAINNAVNLTSAFVSLIILLISLRIRMIAKIDSTKPVSRRDHRTSQLILSVVVLSAVGLGRLVVLESGVASRLEVFSIAILAFVVIVGGTFVWMSPDV